MKKIISFFLFLFFFFSSSSFLRAEPSLKLKMAPTTRIVLPNGLRLLIRERDDTDDVAIYLMVGAGQLTEQESQTGITNLLQNYLVESPVENYHDAATAVEAQGGVTSAASGPDTSDFSFSVPSRAFPFALKVLSDLMHENQVDPKRFDEVKQNTLDEIKNSETQSYQALYGIFLQEFYTFHPYRVPVLGTPSTVKGIKPDDLLHYFQQYYVPNNMVLAIVGKVDTDRVIHVVNHYFSNMQRKKIQPQSIYYQPILSDEKHIQLQESGNVAWLFVGFSAPELRSSEYEPMEVINSVLGSSMSSRIWLSLREKRGLSYELGSQYSVRQGPSHFIIFVATNPQNLNESKGNLLKEVDRIRRQSLTDEELAIVKRRIVGHFILGLETNSAQAKFLAWSEISGKGLMFDQAYISLIEAVTSEEVLRVAKKYLENYILISVE